MEDADENNYRTILNDAIADFSDGMPGVPFVNFAMECRSSFTKVQISVESKNLYQLDRASVGAMIDELRRTCMASSGGRNEKDEFLVYGHETVKQTIQQAITYPRKYAAIYKEFEATPPTGLLLFGPPGSGKSYLVRSIAKKIVPSFINIELSSILCGEVGVAESKLRDLFIESRKIAPCIIFIDEFQALFTKRDNLSDGSSSSSLTLTTCLMTCIDDIADWNNLSPSDSMVSIIAATNEPWSIDSAFLRSRRFDQVVFVGGLDRSGRRDMLVGEAKRNAIEYDVDVDVDYIASRTEGFSAADMSLLFQRACRFCVDDYMNSSIKKDLQLKHHLSLQIRHVHFGQALAITRSSYSAEDINEYFEWSQEYRTKS